MTSIRPCPNCKVIGKLHKSHPRNHYERFLSYMGIVGYYRCHNCGWRGILLKKKKFRLNPLGIFKTLFLLILIYYIVFNVLKSFTN